MAEENFTFSLVKDLGAFRMRPGSAIKAAERSVLRSLIASHLKARFFLNRQTD